MATTPTRLREAELNWTEKIKLRTEIKLRRQARTTSFITEQYFVSFFDTSDHKITRNELNRLWSDGLRRIIRNTGVLTAITDRRLNVAAISRLWFAVSKINRERIKIWKLDFKRQYKKYECGKVISKQNLHNL